MSVNMVKALMKGHMLKGNLGWLRFPKLDVDAFQKLATEFKVVHRYRAAFDAMIFDSQKGRVFSKGRSAALGHTSSLLFGRIPKRPNRVQ